MKKFLTAVLAAGALFATMLPSTAQQPLGIGTLPQGSLGYAIASALAKVMTEQGGLETRAVGLGGSSVYIPQVNAGEMAFATSNTFESVFAVTGSGNFDGRANPNVRVAAALVPFSVGFMVRDASDIKQMSDLKGKRLAAGYVRQKLVEVMQNAIFKAVGLEASDFDPVPVPNFAKGAQLLAEGKVDAVLLAPGSGIVKQTNAQEPIRFLSLPQGDDVAATLDQELPSTRLVTVEPNPRLEGVKEPLNLLGYQYTLVTHAGMDDDTVYKAVKTLAENQEKLAEAHGLFRRFDPEKMAPALRGAEYHPGAVKYYKERGWWTGH